MDVAVDTVVDSNEITISGLKEGGKSVARVEGGTLVVNDQEVSGDSTQVSNGDRVKVTLHSSAEYATPSVAKLTISTYTSQFSVTTDDYVPDDFDFISVENAQRDSLYTSEAVKLRELPHATLVILNNGELLVNGTEVVDNQAVLKSGDNVKIRLSASSSYETDVYATLQVGAIRKRFTVRTKMNPWQKKADRPTEDFYRTMSFIIRDNIYIIDFSASSMHTYNAGRDKWTEQSISIPSVFERNRSGMMCFTVNEKAYIGLGGYSKNTEPYAGNKEVYTYRDFWEYDPIAISWTRKSDFPGENINEATSFIIDGKAYITNGYYDDPNYENDFDKDDYLYTKQTWEYDPFTDQWTRKADFPGENRKAATGFGFNGKGLLGGGGRGYYRYTVEDFWKYDPRNDNWEKQASFTKEFKLGQYNGSCAFFSSNSTLHFITTYDETYFKRYDATYNLWHDVELPKGFWSVGVISNKQRTYVLNRQHGSYELWEYTSPQD